MVDNIFTKDKGSDKFWFAYLGFIVVFLIVFSFQYLGRLSDGIKDNYNSIFCTHL